MRQKRHILLRSFKCVHIFSSSYVHYFCLLHNYIIIRKHLHGKYRRLAVLTVSLCWKKALCSQGRRGCPAASVTEGPAGRRVRMRAVNPIGIRTVNRDIRIYFASGANGACGVARKGASALKARPFGIVSRPHVQLTTTMTGVSSWAGASVSPSAPTLSTLASS